MRNNLPTDKLEFVIEYLRYLEDGGEPISGQAGLCRELETLQTNPFQWPDSFDPCFDQPPWWWCEQWDEYSGSSLFPVPSGDDYFSSRRRFDVALDTYDWKAFWGDHEYGGLRREYCGHVADYLEHFRSKSS